jgi:hypothetical protein
METKLPSEEVGMWIAPLVEERAEALRGCCEEWASEHLEALEEIEPDLLGLANRRAEVWWALLAIGEHVAGEWQERAQAAARRLGSGGDETDSPAPQVQLLSDLWDAFDGHRTIFTEDLLRVLNELDESPWGARRRGEGLDPIGLARMLRPFKIRPKKVRVGEEVRKGYHLDQFEEVFARYLIPSPYGEHGATRGTAAPQRQANVPHVPDVAPSDGAGAAQPRPAPPCRYPAHRKFDWAGDGGKIICGICHPKAGA